jgi:hypothetical protein
MRLLFSGLSSQPAAEQMQSKLPPQQKKGESARIRRRASTAAYNFLTIIYY